MKVGLVSAYTHPFALGLRYLSSYLKTMGHEVELYFMSSKRDTTAPDFSDAALEDLSNRLRDSDLIGVSLMTNNFHRARAITEHLRNGGLRAPIVWGGTHPTVMPDECLEHADAVCVGEGEEPLLQLLEQMEHGDPTRVPGMHFRGGGRFGNAADVRNALGPLETRLDDLPFPDYELERHWVAEKEGLAPATRSNLRGALDTLRVITTRGCPYRCTFCNNAALREVHEGAGRWVRMRSLDNVLDELRKALACFPSIRTINFIDDLFFVRKQEEIDRFVEAYARDVNLPLQMDAFPNTVTEAKVASLARIPLELISMGVESASEDTLRNIYQRPTAKKRIAEALDIFNRYKVPLEVHYIVSNPFEPEENVIESMRFIADHHHGPAVLRVFPLMFYPHTPLYDRARAEGMVGTRDDVAYDFMGTGSLQFAKHDYLAIWLRAVLNMRNVGVPSKLCHWTIDAATSRPVRFVCDRKWFGPTVFVTYFVGRKLVKNLLYQPIAKPWGYLKRAWTPKRRGTPQPWRLGRENPAADRHRASKPITKPLADIASPPTPAADTIPGSAGCNPASPRRV